MSNFEVPNPILSSPFEEPKEHWWVLEGEPALKVADPRGYAMLAVRELAEAT